MDGPDVHCTIAFDLGRYGILWLEKNNGLLTFVLVAAMIGGHLFMMKGHSGKGEKHH